MQGKYRWRKGARGCLSQVTFEGWVSLLAPNKRRSNAKSTQGCTWTAHRHRRLGEVHK
jgi:hypothetical protein